MRSRCVDGWMVRGGERGASGGASYSNRDWGGGGGEDGRTVMKTAAAGAATGRHDRKTDASGNPI